MLIICLDWLQVLAVVMTNQVYQSLYLHVFLLCLCVLIFALAM